MRIRVTCTHDEIDRTVASLRILFDVREVSGWYPNRGSSTIGRVYIDAELPPDLDLTDLVPSD